MDSPERRHAGGGEDGDSQLGCPIAGDSAPSHPIEAAQKYQKRGDREEKQSKGFPWQQRRDSEQRNRCGGVHEGLKIKFRMNRIESVSVEPFLDISGHLIRIWIHALKRNLCAIPW